MTSLNIFSTELKIQRHVYNNVMSWVIWITGLPGSGKSTVALSVKEKIPDAAMLSIDALRHIVTPAPDYSDTEREHVYRALVFTAHMLHELGHDVIIDATAHKNSWRVLARELIPEFYEVYLKCPVALCMKREKKRKDTHAAPTEIYEKGKKGWPVPGIQVPYEEPDKPEIIINTENESPETAAGKIVKIHKSRT